MAEPDLTAAIEAATKAIDAACDSANVDGAWRLEDGAEYYDMPGVFAQEAATFARAAITAAAELIVADTLKRERERMTGALLHILAVSNPRDRWDEGYAAGIGEAIHWITPGAPVTDKDFARGSGGDETARQE